MRRVEQIATVVAWAVLAALLFAAFGFFLAHAFASTLVRVGLMDEGGSGLAGDLARVAVGVVLLGVAWIYRRLAGSENAGSLAAWLAGWGLLLYSLTSLASMVDEHAAPIVLLAILSVWLIYRLSRYFFDLSAGGPDEEE
jgi:hypothetical protein